MSRVMDPLTSQNSRIATMSLALGMRTVMLLTRSQFVNNSGSADSSWQRSIRQC